MNECPCCGETLTVKTWHDDVGLVEIRKECSCGYIYHWSYGTIVEEVIPDEIH